MIDRRSTTYMNNRKQNTRTAKITVETKKKKSTKPNLLTSTHRRRSRKKLKKAKTHKWRASLRASHLATIVHADVSYECARG